MPTDRLFRAIAFRLISVLAFATMAALIKLAELRGARLIELLFFRQLGALPVVLGVVAFGPGLSTLATRRLPAHLLRTAVGMASMACMFLTVMLLPLAEATTLQFTVPIFATILGAVVLREATGIHRWSAVIIGFLGVLIVTQPGSGHIPLIGAVTGLAAALLSSVVSILLRHMGRTEPATTTVFYFSLLSLGPLGIAFALGFEGHDARTWVILAAIGVVGGMGQIAMTSALSLAPVAVVVPMDYSGLIWASIFGWALFGALPGNATWIGAPVIVASGLYIVWREHRLSRVTTTTAVSA